MVQQQMQFHRSFRPLEFGPGEKRDAQVNRARFQTRQLVLERKFLFPSRLRQRLAFLQQLSKHRLVQL